MRWAHPPVRNSQSLEDDLGCELHVEGFAGADARSAVEVADGVAYETSRTDRTAAGLQIDPVQQVKHLRPELYFEALAHRNVLKDREVDGSVSRPVKPVAGEGAK